MTSKEGSSSNFPEPVNTLYLPDEEGMEYFRRFKAASEKDDAQIQYKGSEDLRKLIEEKKAIVGAIIRMTHGSVHVFHLLTPFGLVNYLDKSHPISTFEEVLDQRESGRLTPWAFDGLELQSHDALEELKKGPHTGKK